jgi:hypothetical protein
VSTNSFCAKSHSFRGENAQENGEKKKRRRAPSLDKTAKNNYTTNRKGAVRNGQLLPVGSIRMTAYRLETGAVISYCYGSL